MAARAPRLEAEDALALAHFQGKNNLLRRLNALKRADFSRHADRIRCPVQIICASDDLLVPTACSSELHAALPDSQKMVMRYGGHACNVTDPETFNALLLNGLASLLHHRDALTLVAMRIVSAARCKSSAPVTICWCQQHVPVNFMPPCPIARKW